MEKITIEESGMLFGEYPKDSVFRIEECALLRSIDSAKPVEFILLKDLCLFFVEAKTSSPKDHEVFVTEVEKKMSHSFYFWISIFSGVRSYDSVGIQEDSKLRDIPADVVRGTKFILVIRNAKGEYLPPIRDSLIGKMKLFLKLMGVSPMGVMVLNEELAKNKGFIV